MAFDRSSYSSIETFQPKDDLDRLSDRVSLSGNEGNLSNQRSKRGTVALRDLLRNLDPYQEPGVWVYSELQTGMPLPAGTVVTVMEKEGQTVVLAEDDARNAGLEPLFRAAWITLRVHSALEAVGLVAQVSSRLADAGISCNIIAGARHDHILVPYELAEDALNVLRNLQLQQ